MSDILCNLHIIQDSYRLGEFSVAKQTVTEFGREIEKGNTLIISIGGGRIYKSFNDVKDYDFWVREKFPELFR